MNEAVEFLMKFARALSIVGLYPPSHTTRQGALDDTYQCLQDLFEVDKHPIFSFLGDEVVLGTQPLRELRDWEWSSRLAAIGMQRLEFDSNVPITPDELDSLMDKIVSRFTVRGTDSPEMSQEGGAGIRFGAVGVGDEGELVELEETEILTGTIPFSLEDEAGAVVWLHDVVRAGGQFPLMEAESVVRSLAVIMHGHEKLMLPLLQLGESVEYATTHSVNVSVLSMALGEWLGLGPKDVHALGVAGLLHDLGKVRIPDKILNKPGRFTPQETEIMQTHVVEGARMILTSGHELDLAATVAYEHHVMIDGGGYPSFRYPRDCHYASKLVHVCDVYDALCAPRPFRDAWPAKRAFLYVREQAGTEFDEEIARTFCDMIEEWRPRLSTLKGDDVELVPESPLPTTTP